MLTLALVFALGALGVGYASWTDAVTIEQTVNTGDVCAGVRDVGTDDDPGDEDDVANNLGDNDPGWQEGALVTYEKDVASAVSENVGDVKCSLDDTDYYDSVTLTLDNAYPSYAPTETLEFANCGSIPVIVTGLDRDPLSDPDGLEPFVQVVTWTVTYPNNTSQSGSGMGELRTEVVGQQLDEGDVVTVDLTKHILQEVDGDECPQNASVTETYTVSFIQWNEA